jgi:hypothetical protein
MMTRRLWCEGLNRGRTLRSEVVKSTRPGPRNLYQCVNQGRKIGSWYHVA